jgi:hypothetical protein
MMIHKARVLKESVVSLGLDGMAFSVICCEDKATVTRHTIHKAHTLTDDELRELFTAYAKRAAQSHLASTRNETRAKQIAGDLPGCEVCE